MTIAISVVIVSQKRPLELERAIASLVHQTVQNFEVIVVADAPPLTSKFLSASVQFIQTFEANISRARNLGIMASGSPIIAFCDDDATPDPSWLELLCAPFFDDSNIGAAGGFSRGRNGVSYQWQGVGFLANGKDACIDIVPQTGAIVFDLNPELYVKTVGTNCAFRRDVLHNVGGYDEAFHYYLDDADINKRIQDAGWKTAIVPRAEIIHNYKASRGRSDNRVPKSLYNLGASTRHFASKHDPENLDEILTDFADHQHKRLKNFFHLGLMRPRQIKALMRDLALGFEAGAQRVHAHPLKKIRTQKLVPLDVAPFELRFVGRNAPEPENGIVYVSMRMIPTGHGARFFFKRRGHWSLRFGRFGRLHRKERFWTYRTREQARTRVKEFVMQRFQS